VQYKCADISEVYGNCITEVIIIAKLWMLIAVPNIKCQHSENKQTKKGETVGFALEVKPDETGINL